MSEDPIREYSNAMDELNKANEKIRTIQDIISAVGSGLRQPYQFMVSNVRTGFPIEVAMASVPTLNADDWPSAVQIAEALSNLHHKRHLVENLWHRLSEQDKKIVSPPPER